LQDWISDFPWKEKGKGAWWAGGSLIRKGVFLPSSAGKKERTPRTQKNDDGQRESITGYRRRLEERKIEKLVRETHRKLSNRREDTEEESPL